MVEDLIGKRFGFLTVVERAKDHVSRSGRKRTKWICLCDCGNHTEVLATNLKQGKIISCGCYKKEVTDFKKKYNNYDLSGEFGIGYTSKGEEFYFDLEDYDKIKDYTWYKNDQGYLIAHIKDGNVRMHRLIMDASDDYEVDHIHGKETRHDNRKFNLRLVTHSQNNWNKDKLITNTSGYRGVSWSKTHGKWESQIEYNHNHLHLGFFEDVQEAYDTRLKAEEKYFGEYSYDNSMRYYQNIKDII